jgi:NAD(P)H-flavin reductase
MIAQAACDPANPWMALPAIVDEVVDETPGVATYNVQLQNGLASQFRFRPGQFNMLYLPGVGEIAISISGDPRDTSRLPHTIRETGVVTSALARLGRTAALGVRGPFGTSWPMNECGGKDVVLVAGGIGLAPLRPAIYELLADRSRYGSLTLVYGARTQDDLLYSRQFDDWTSRGLKIEVTVDRATRGWQGPIGPVTLPLERLSLPRPSESVLMTCGPEVMMWYVAQTASARGLSDTQIWMSLERTMNCGIGLCGHCQFGPEFICKDGPVFRFDRVVPFLRVQAL